MSCSALRFPVELGDTRAAFESAGTLSSIISVGPGEWFYYGIHAVELLGTITDDRPQWVQRLAFDEKDVAIVAYDSGLVAVVETLREPPTPSTLPPSVRTDSRRWR